jgi:HAD superfamily hydrolase (TIGR01549 family)
MYDGLLLDHDGVVVTLGDERALRQAARDALLDAGVPEPDESAVDTLAIAVTDEELAGLSRQHDLPAEQLWRHRDDRVREALLAETTAGRKAPYDDTARLRDADVPMGVVSNNQTRIVESVLDHYDLRELFGTVRARAPTRESLSRKKPRPTYLEEAMADLGLENPLYVGDSESDVEAGRRAGVDTAFLRRPHNEDRALAEPPTYEVRGLDEVVALVAAPG